MPDGGERLTRPPDNEDARRELALEMLKRHARTARPDTDYDADLDYLEHAIVAFADEWAQRQGERLRVGLDEIDGHFGDQDFPHGQISASCEEVIVNYAGAVLGGYAKSLAEYAQEQYSK